MPNIQFATNLWACYYEDDTEEKGFYIDEVYLKSDPERTNIADWLSESAVEFIEKHIVEDLEEIRSVREMERRERAHCMRYYDEQNG